MPSQKVGAAGQRLLERPFLLERLAKDHAQHAAVPRVGHRLDTRLPSVDECLSLPDILVDLTNVLRCASRGARIRRTCLLDRSTELRNGRRQPREVYFVSVDDVLVSVVGVVLT